MRSGEFKPAVPQPPIEILLLVTAGIQACVLHVRCTLGAHSDVTPFILCQRFFYLPQL